VKFDPLHKSIERDRVKTSLYALGQDISSFSHGKAFNFGEGLEYIKIWSLTKGINLELSTLEDRVDKQNFHLEGWESVKRAEAREEVPTEEEDPRMESHLL
jgi:hypothetical protein